MELPWLCDVLEAFLAALYGIFPLQEESLQCFALLCCSPWPLVAWCFPGELQRFVLDGRRFLMLRTGAGCSIPGRISLDPSLSCPAGSQTSASCDTLRGWMVWKPGDGSWPLQQLHPAQSGEQQPFSGSPWSVAAVPLPWPCPFSHPPGAVAVPLPLLRARMDSWLSPFWLLEQPKISDLVQEEPVPPSHGAQPQACPAWLILFSVLCCWISKMWKTAGCGGQAEPPPALGSPGFGA